MTVKPEQIEITSPCPITLDRSGASPADRELFCGHCSKEVHLLSHMSEAEARELLARREGDDICVSYAIRPDGSIRFRPEPPVVPASALVRGSIGPRRASGSPAPSPLQRSLAMAASIGAAAWLSACTPHSSETEAKPETEDQAKPEPQPEIQEVVAGGLTALPIGDEPCDPELDEPVEGGLKAIPVPEPEPDVVVDGGLEAAPIAEHPKPIPHKAGGLRAMPVPPDSPGID
jgi:hypothetical protein